MVKARLNIVEIIWSDIGDWLSCYGHRSLPSPQLQKFADDGIRFENSFCTAPQCCPSRASLKTGRYPQSNGMLGLTHRGWRYNDDEVDMAEWFNRAGYFTVLFGFQHERQDTSTLTYQKVWIEQDTAIPVSEQAAAFFREFQASRQDDAPFFVSIGLSDVHRNYGDVYNPAVLNDIEVPGYMPDLPIVRRDFATLYENIRIADESLGRILTAIDEAGLAEHTLIYFTSDHGIEFPRAKMTLYDPGIKTALMMKGPGIQPGQSMGQLISNVDILPTLFEATGITIPDCIQGKSFWPLVLGEIAHYEPREEIFAQMTYHGGEYDPMRCIRTRRFKYIRNHMPGWPPQMAGSYVQRYGESFIEQYFSQLRLAEELYDLENDPWEQMNLAEDENFTATKKLLSDKLQRHMEEVNDPLLHGHIARKPSRPYECGWGKFPSHHPLDQEFRMRMIKTRDFKENPI